MKMMFETAFLRSPRIRFLFVDPVLCLQLPSDSRAAGTLVTAMLPPLSGPLGTLTRWRVRSAGLSEKDLGLAP